MEKQEDRYCLKCRHLGVKTLTGRNYLCYGQPISDGIKALVRADAVGWFHCAGFQLSEREGKVTLASETQSKV